MPPIIAPTPAPVAIRPLSSCPCSAWVTVARIEYVRPSIVKRSKSSVIDPFRSMPRPAGVTELTTPRITDPAGTSTRPFFE